MGDKWAKMVVVSLIMGCAGNGTLAMGATALVLRALDLDVSFSDWEAQLKGDFELPLVMLMGAILSGLNVALVYYLGAKYFEKTFYQDLGPESDVDWKVILCVLVLYYSCFIFKILFWVNSRL